MSNIVKISVIVPCYNQGKFLEETCNSIIIQSHVNWEALIINDGSTDNSEEIALKICNLDSRFKYFKKNNGGLSSARNLGLKNATGDYIQFLDSDDLLFRDKLSLSVRKNTNLIITNFEMLEKGKVKPPFCNLMNRDFTFENLLLQWDIDYSIPIHCGLFKSSIAKKIKFNEDLKAKEDWCFWLDFLKETPTITFINEALLYYRIHGKNMTRDNSHMLKNKKKVYLFLFNSLSDIHRNLFFKRINEEYTEEQKKSNFMLKKQKKERKRVVVLSIFLLFIFSILIINLI